MNITRSCISWIFLTLISGLISGPNFLDYSLHVDDTKRTSYSPANTLVARGNHAASIVYDGLGRTFYLSQMALPTIIIYAGATLTLKNLTLVGFRSEHVSLISSTSKLLFGEGVVLKLDRDLDVTTSLTFVGNAMIDGDGKVLALKDKAALIVTSNVALTVRDCTVKGIKDFVNYDGSKATSIMCSKDGGHLILNSATCLLDAAWTLTAGRLTIERDVSFTSTWATFAYNSNMPLTILPRSTLLFERGITFNYASSAGPNNLILSDNSSSLVFRNSNFLSGPLGASMSLGSLFIKGDVFFKNVATSPVAGITLDRSLFTAILAGSTLCIDGIVAHGKPA